MGMMGTYTIGSSGDCSELEGKGPSKEGGCYSVPADCGQNKTVFILFHFERENINLGFYMGSSIF